ncbi:MAG: hypothetical protein M9947_06815 [Thermomicrobiales bacterium]|nr:hypothetical protein [Thermomicrobiales bacterium]
MSGVSGTRHRTGKGEIVPRKYELEIARREFFAALWELVPESMEPLYQMDWLISSEIGTKWERAVLILGRWLESYRLTDLWGCDPLRYLPNAGSLSGRSGLDRPVSIYEGRDRKRDQEMQDGVTVIMPGQSPYVMRNGMFRDSDSYVVLVAHLLYSDDEYEEWPGDADIGEFDPRADTEDQAVARILPVLERRLRYGLQGIKSQDRAGDTVPTRALPSRHHFEWTVRYQVLGETIRHIAESDDIEQKTVSTNIRKVAELIGLTLRQPDKGGRPRKLRTRTISRKRTETPVN